jgi:hypothetical protein
LSNCEIENPARFDLQFTQLQNCQITQSSKICPKTTNPLCPGNGKRGSGMADKFSHPESHVPRFRAESWHLAVVIYDPDPVAVAS